MGNQPEVRCLSCSVLSVREARFCRQCGALLRHDDLVGDGEISPDALTIELREPKRQTRPLAPPTERATGQQPVIPTAEVGLGLPSEPSAAISWPSPHLRYAAVIALLLVVAAAGTAMWRRSRHQPAISQNALALATLAPLPEPRDEAGPRPRTETVPAGGSRVRVPGEYRPAPATAQVRIRRPFKVVQITKAHPSGIDHEPGSARQTARLGREARPTLTIRRREYTGVRYRRTSNIVRVPNVKQLTSAGVIPPRRH